MLRMILAGVTVALLMGCGSKVTYVDAAGGSGGGTEPCPGADCAAPGCPATAPSHGTSCDLPDFTECRYADPVMGGCDSVYQCQPVFPEAGAPSEWYFMGQQGLCECEAASCDPGDAEVSDCIPDAGCYTADGHCVDEVIVCADVALPQHGCPFVEPQDGDPCSAEGLMCDYSLGSGCFTSNMCDGGQWWSIGGGCDGSGG